MAEKAEETRRRRRELIDDAGGVVMNPEVCELVITGISEEWISDFTPELVEARLAACGTSHPAH